MNSWDVRALLPAVGLLAYALAGGADWPLKTLVFWGLALWFAVTAATGLAAMYASAKDDAEIHHESGVAGQSGSWAEILRDGLRLGAAPFLWLAAAGWAAAALGGEAIPRPETAAALALAAGLLAFASGLAWYAVNVRASARRFRTR